MFPTKIKLFGAKIWEGGSSPSKKAGVYPCTSKIGCVQSSALVCGRDKDRAVGASFHIHAEFQNLFRRTHGAWILPLLEADLLPDMQTLPHFAILCLCLNRSGYVRIILSPKKVAAMRLGSLAQALQTNISLADLWLRGMAMGAASSGRTVQWPGLNLLLATAEPVDQA